MPYVGEIRMFAGNFGPVGWMLCQGQALPISEHETLFNLIGTIYGGDGETTFNLPDLRGRMPIEQGRGPGITQPYRIGEPFGTESVTLNPQQLPIHNHALLASTAPGTTVSPENAVIASSPSVTMFLREAPAADLPAPTVGPTGGSLPHENRAPVLAINYIISLFGVYPHQ